MSGVASHLLQSVGGTIMRTPREQAYDITAGLAISLERCPGRVAPPVNNSADRAVLLKIASGRDCRCVTLFLWCWTSRKWCRQILN